MLFQNIGLLDEGFTYQGEMSVGTKNGKIAYIGKERPAEDLGEVYDGKGKLLMHGFCNAHSHAPMTLLRGYAENLPLNRWLNERVFPFEDCLTGEDAYNGTMLAIAEMLRTGTTSFTDMYYFGEDVARAVIESGIKCNFSRAITSFADGDLQKDSRYLESEALIANFHNAADGRLKIDMSLHAEYTNRRMIMEQFGALAKAHGLHVHIHLSETEAEHEECKGRHGGLTPAQLFDACGVFDSPTTAAHCVWLEDGDREILKAKGVTVATCPASNLKLGSGVCDTNTLLEMGINVALGTDSVASNNNLNMMKDIYLAAILPKGFLRRPEIITPRDVLKMATVNGYRAQGRAGGTITLGAPADLTVMDIDTPNMYPATDMLNNLVYSANGGDILLTMVDGRVLYKDGEFKTIDIEKIKYACEKATKRILSEVKA